MTVFASGKWALGICDFCGFRGKLRTLVWDHDTEAQAFKVHKDCADKLNPDIVIARKRRLDGEALRYPRPDRAQILDPDF